MAAGRIIVDLLLRTGSFETDSKKAARALRELKKEAIDAGKTLAIGAVAYAAAAALFVKSAIDSADAASKAAQSAGVTTEAFTSIGYAADLAGVELETLGKAFAKLNKGIAEQDETLISLGVALRDAAGNARGADDVLEDLADRFAKMADGPEKAALAAKIFGERIGPKLIPLLNAGKGGIAALREEARRLGVEIGTNTGKAAEEFNDNISRLQTQVKGLAVSLAADLLPQLVKLSDRLVQNAKDFGLAQGAAVTFFESIFGGTELSDVAGKKLAELQVQARSLEEEIGLAVDAGRESRARVLTAKLVQIEAQIAAVQGQVGLAKSLEASTAPKPATAPMLKAPAEPRDTKKLDAYLEALRKAREAVFDLTTYEQALADIRAGSLGKITPKEEARVLVLAEQVDLTKQLVQAAKDAAAEQAAIAEAEDAAIRTRAEADRQRLDSLLSGTFTARMQKARDDIAFLNAQFSAGAIKTVEQWAEAVKAATASIADNAEKAAEKMDEFAKNAAQNIQQYLGSAFADAMEGNFQNIGKSFTQMINRMVAEALAADLTRRLFGAAGGGAGEGWIGALAQWAGAAFAGAKAGGGDVVAGRSYLVGERGPETFVPRTAGTILPAAQRGQGAAGAKTVNITLQGAAGASRQSQVQQAEMIGREVMLALNRNG